VPVDSAFQNQDHWTTLYEIAIREPDRAKRMRLLLQAERAVLERAIDLEREENGHEAEEKALEEAASFIREMKLNTMNDGVGKELKCGDKNVLKMS
jgi:hypothetical protein